MASSTIGIILVIAICAVMLGIGFLVSKRNKTTEDYFVGGRSLGSLVTICTQCATWVGGGMVLGWIGQGATRGIAGIHYMWPQALGFLFVSYFMVKPLRKDGLFISLPDWFDNIYHDKTLRVVAAIMCLIVPITWITSQTTAAARMLEGIGIPYLTGVLFIGGVVLLYSTFGGYLAVVYTDTVQWLCLLAIYVCTIPFGLIYAGGVRATLAGVSQGLLNAFQVPNMPSYTFWLWLVNGLVAAMGLQTTFQRGYSAKTDKIARRGLNYSAAVTIVFAVLAVLTGLACVKLGMPSDLASDKVWPWFLANYMPTWVALIYTVLVMMATMSSADSNLNSISMSISHDIYSCVINPKADDKKVLKVGIIASGLIGILALYWATAGNWMLKIFGYGYTLGAGPLAAATFTVAFFREKANSKFLIAGMIIGGIFGVITTFIPALKDVPAGGTVFSFGAAFIVCLLGVAVNKKKAVPAEA